jgi:hypothetical protein
VIRILGNLQFDFHSEEVTPMAASRDFLSRQRDQITKRLEELRPLYDEYLTLEKAREALEGLEGPVRRVVRRGRGPGRPRKRVGRPPGRRATATKAGPGRRAAGGRRRKPAAGRKRAGGTRADHAVNAIKANPGITIPELAQKLKIRPNYLYRVTAQLQKERRIRKRGRGFHPA